MTAHAPRATDAARELDVDEDLLLLFIDFHTRPEPRHLLQWSDAKDPDRRVVAAWLGDYIADDPERFADEVIDRDDTVDNVDSDEDPDAPDDSGLFSQFWRGGS